MFDIQLRPWKDGLIDPLCTLVPRAVTPLHLTAVAFVCGVSACVTAARGFSPLLSVGLWLANRVFDCLDGAVARHRNQASDLGGFLDLLGDFVVYSMIPIACAFASMNVVVPRVGAAAAAVETEETSPVGLWLSVTVVEACFHVNNFVLFYVGAVAEKRRADKMSQGKEAGVKELTSVIMRPALIEGFESGVIFTFMLAVPEWTQWLCWSMAVLVGVGIVQRVVWVVPVLS